MYIDTETLIIAVYLVVNNWYLAEGRKYQTAKPGRKPDFTDTEVISFMILKEFLGFGSERQFLGFMNGNYSFMFPHIVHQSQYNRRTRVLGLVVDKLRSHFAREFGAQLASLYILNLFQ